MTRHAGDKWGEKKTKQAGLMKEWRGGLGLGLVHGAVMRRGKRENGRRLKEKLVGLGCSE